MKSKGAIAILMAGTALLAGCHKKGPSGQVAATVNGQEVTLQEINTELTGTSFPADADKQVVQRALLQRIIDRKLLVGAAEDKKLDKTPEFLAQKRRMDELLLAQTYAKQQLSSVPVPTQAELDKFMADHPNAYAKREVLELDQIRFTPPANPKPLEALAQDHSLDAVAARLTTLGIQFKRGKANLDTAQVPPAVLDQINKLPASEPFVIPQPGVVTANVIIARQAVQPDPTAARQTATRAWRQQKFASLLQDQLNALKSGAKITYQSGFGPPDQGKAGAPAPAAKPAG
ncbi:EpsD family peptidyl-prolyl cis-trans isomerase [Sphingomonas vulcanisoli]|uniref:EpsD family peptidyl-prolyl cis-trans isomerase n=1 Tax=Sphingomonas vulcanisoli TaxID=1658060 RepID=A0ABX0TQL7_9SPHN|nr:EpsD family peptidyl-prolyl cis-trans isomerase [Sphingomonas vulcanisoli]NIJ07802.1 EpsD family peptidyl-prolyl cis-trans isomerase [Sphingomonas vulcanisoli]